MQIVSCEIASCHYLEIDGADNPWRYYRRASEGDWEIRMGESWEAVYDCAELESAFIKFNS